MFRKLLYCNNLRHFIARTLGDSNALVLLLTLKAAEPNIQNPEDGMSDVTQFQLENARANEEADRAMSIIVYGFFALVVFVGVLAFWWLA